MSFLVAASLAGSSLFAVGVPSASAASISVAAIGTSADQAAGSCWEIKQARPSAADGAYWLLTPAMSQPQQFYCDMTTDGGGWVLVGKGRDGWVTDYDGRGREAALTSPNTSPMSAATVQLPSRKIDALLNHSAVSSLPDGIRLRRATNTSGTTWQESRMNFAKGDRWSWTFGAAHPLTSFSFDGTSTSGGTSSNFGTDTAYRRVVSTTAQSQGYHLGFAYGSGVTGTSSSTSYLWSKTDGGGGALPYTLVYLRPKVTSTDSAFTAIPDSGTQPTHQTSVASSLADDLPWHVAGLAGNSTTEGNVEVQAFTQSGDTMFVGGNFRYVQKAANSTGTDQVSQPFLAGFNVETGELLRTFRPVLNEQVRSLATLPNGDVVAGGMFTQANGAPATGIVALNSTTGATDRAWRLSIENRVGDHLVDVKALKVQGNHLYLGGAFTHLTGGSSTDPAYMRNGAEVSAVDGTPRRDWNPNLNGTVLDLDPSADGSRVYFSGYFGTSNGIAAKSVAAVLTSAGAPLASPAWNPTWSSTNKFYQRAVEAVGNHVYVGGSEHSLFQFSTSTFDRTAGHIMMNKGDIQAIADSGDGVIYAGCHCNQWNYTNAFLWPSIGTAWTQVDTIRWFGAYNSSTEDTIPSFTPTIASRAGLGVWAIDTDTNGRVWAGGDLSSATTVSGAGRFAGGFTRFSLNDSTPPSSPSGLRVTSTTSSTATLTWNGSSDASGAVTYEVLRDDRTIASTKQTTITVPLGGNNRFFVRAADDSDNISGSTSVQTANAAPNVPPVAKFTATTNLRTGTFDATASDDSDGSIISYTWDFGDGATGSGVKTTHTYSGDGTFPVTLTVVDNGGATASTTSSVTTTSTSTTDTVVVQKGSSWAWRYVAAAPPSGWNSSSFDASGWSTSKAPLGFGSSGVATNIDTFSSTSDRPLAAYFTRSFEVPDASKVTRLQLETVADDGVVVYVNGTEVGRSNMPTGSVGPNTYASTARSTATANGDPVVIAVPTSLLVTGRNVVSSETHLNYRGTRDASFDLQATLTSMG